MAEPLRSAELVVPSLEEALAMPLTLEATVEPRFIDARGT